MTTQILDIIKLVAVDDEELNEEDLMNVVDALDQPHHHVIAEESRQQPRQWPRISQTDKNFSMIGVGNFFRFWSHSDWQLPVTINWQIPISDVLQNAAPIFS